MNEMTIEVKCPLCDEEKNVPYRFEDRKISDTHVLLGLNRCISCKLQYISPRLNQDALTILYDTEYHTNTVSGAYNVNETVSLHEYQMFKSYLLKFLPDGGKVLDIGCGVGNMLQQIRNLSIYNSSGIEISKDAAQRAQKNGLKVFQGNLSEARLESESFDAVFLLYVLEHVDNPLWILKEINRILKKDGLLFLAVPNYRYLRIAFDNCFSRLLFKNKVSLHPEEHLQNFTPKTLEKMVCTTNFRILMENCAKPLSIGSIATRLFKKVMYIFVKTLSFFGYNIGGIHLIAQKQ